MRRLCRHLVGRGSRWRGALHRAGGDDERHRGHTASRRWMEVLVERRVDRRPRYGRRARHTHQLLVTSHREVEPEIARAVEALRAGELVAFPTETVYGLGADAASSAAVAHLY